MKPIKHTKFPITRNGEARKVRARIIKRIVKDYAFSSLVVFIILGATLYFGGHLICALLQGNL